MRVVLLIPLALLVLINCSAPLYKPASTIVELQVEFADPDRWNGIKIPNEGWGRDIGGPGYSPALIVKNIPSGTNAVVVEFNDIDQSELSVAGGHGAYYVLVDNRAEISILSVKELTHNLPGGVFLEHSHRAAVISPKAAYLAPGSGSHTYTAVVMAVYKDEAEPKKSRLLGKALITLGSPHGKK